MIVTEHVIASVTALPFHQKKSGKCEMLLDFKVEQHIDTIICGEKAFRPPCGNNGTWHEPRNMKAHLISFLGTSCNFGCTPCKLALH